MKMSSDGLQRALAVQVAVNGWLVREGVTLPSSSQRFCLSTVLTGPRTGRWPFGHGRNSRARLGLTPGLFSDG